MALFWQQVAHNWQLLAIMGNCCPEIALELPIVLGAPIGLGFLFCRLNFPKILTFHLMLFDNGSRLLYPQQSESDEMESSSEKRSPSPPSTSDPSPQGTHLAISNFFQPMSKEPHFFSSMSMQSGNLICLPYNNSNRPLTSVSTIAHETCWMILSP